jgi:translocator assembly and maintenance protein 41
MSLLAARCANRATRLTRACRRLSINPAVVVASQRAAARAFRCTRSCYQRQPLDSTPVLPLPPLHATTHFVATYGSAAFNQITEEEAEARAANHSAPPPPPPPLADEPMLDLIFAVPDPLSFHRANMQRNPSHYSFLRWASGWPAALTAVQEYGAGVWYNTLIRLDIPGHPGQTKLVKYGVISTERLIRDLHDWDALYIAGRMHKPMHIIQCTDQIRLAAESNLRSALRTSLLLIDSKPPASSAAAPSRSAAVAPSSPPTLDASALPSSPAFVRFTGQALFTVVASLSYAGDIRMAFAENPQKVAKIVAGNWHDLVRLYAEPIRTVLGEDKKIEKMSDVVEVECDTKRRMELIQQLPRQVKREMADLAEVTEESIESTREQLPAVASLPASDRHALLTGALARIVRRSSQQQTMKGLLTAGFRKSFRYGWAKIQKAMRK